MDAFIYARISEDRDGASTAPERQIADARELIAREGWREAGVYVDRDISASKASVTRPDFERVLVDAARGGGVIVAQDQDRLLRQPVDAERLIALAVDGVQVRTTRGDTGTGMLGDAYTRFAVRLKAVLGAHESDHIAARQRRKHREKAEKGIGHATRHRPFGHTPDFRAHETEAPIVRELVARALEGERIPSLCRDLNARGVTSTTGAQWRHQPMRKLLSQARLAGARELDGDLIATGAIEPLISVAQLIELRAVLAMPKRTGTRTNARRHLLSGFLFCGVCGERMNPLPQARGMRYACPLPSNPHRPGCGRVSIVGDPLEAAVRLAILEALQTDRLAELIEAEAADDGISEAVAMLRAVDARIAELDADYADGAIDRRRYRGMLDRLEARRSSAEARIVAADQQRSRISLPLGAHAEAKWDAGDLAYRRQILEALISRVVIQPAAKLGRTFDPERIALEWAV
jgi:DNA invertase Pin-like site-specific DNA recombinase